MGAVWTPMRRTLTCVHAALPHAMSPWAPARAHLLSLSCLRDLAMLRYQDRASAVFPGALCKLSPDGDTCPHLGVGPASPRLLQGTVWMLCTQELTWRKKVLKGPSSAIPPTSSILWGK